MVSKGMARSSLSQLKALQKTVDEWNRQHPVGTRVKVTNNAGVATQAETSAPAMLLAKSTPVVWLKGVYNHIQLSRVQVI
ncbi:MAG: hypothetical protein ACXV8O_05035 [Methylobacter sp.]